METPWISHLKAGGANALYVRPPAGVGLRVGVLLRDRLRHAEALDRFQRVLAINPNYESALGNSGIILTEFKRSAEAIAIFDRLAREESKMRMIEE